jgi:hypothetical protein
MVLQYCVDVPFAAAVVVTYSQTLQTGMYHVCFKVVLVDAKVFQNEVPSYVWITNCSHFEYFLRCWILEMYRI